MLTAEANGDIISSVNKIIPTGQAMDGSLWKLVSLVRDRPGTSRSELAKTTSLSKAYVSHLVNVLLQADLIYEGEIRAKSKNGRKPVPLHFNERAFYTIALDIGGTYVKSGILNGLGMIVVRRVEKTRPQRINKQVSDIIRKLQKLAEREHYRMLGIGIGVAGTVDYLTGTVYSAACFGWQDINLKKLVESWTELPVVVDNDVNLAALGEYWRGAGRGYSSIVCISVGTGIGAGIIINGNLYRGAHNLAGEIGYSYLEKHLPDAPFSSYGALELEAGGMALKSRNRSGALKQAFTTIGIAVANAASLLDPDAIILTGGVVNAARHSAVSSITKAVQYILPPEMRSRIKVKLGILEQPVLTGAAYLAERIYFSQFVYNVMERRKP